MITLLIRRLQIACPICKRHQTLEQHRKSRIWFPIPPFCCDIMRTADTPEWNALVDNEIKKNNVLSIS